MTLQLMLGISALWSAFAWLPLRQPRPVGHLVARGPPFKRETVPRISKTLYTGILVCLRTGVRGERHVQLRTNTKS